MRGRTYARRRQDRQHIADREDAYSRSATPDNVGLVTCAVTRYDREDVADREGVADRTDVHDREDYQRVADRTNVSDWEIGKILPIGKNDCLIHFQKQFLIEFEYNFM
jgi:hypothetical protein